MKFSNQKGSIASLLLILAAVVSFSVLWEKDLSPFIETPPTGTSESIPAFTPLGEGSSTIGVLPFKIKVSSGDTTPNYIFSKLVAGSNITLTKNNAGANETITIASSGGGSGSPCTSTPNSLQYESSTNLGCVSGATSDGTSITITSGNLKLAGASSGTSTLNAAAAAGTTTLTLPAATDTLVGKATTDTFTNKTFDTAGSGNSFSINGLAATANTGTGDVVRATSPTLVTPALGTPSAIVLTNGTGLPISTGVSGLGTGVATFLGTPSSANLATAVTDETGSGLLVFGTSPTLTTPTLGAATYTTLSGGAITNSALTSGRVTFASTAGLMADDADMTFATDTLTITKIAATSFTGNVTLSDVNLVLGTTTGTKIGTSTSQKLGFYNATPIVQPSGDVATALSNLGLIATPTIASTTVSSADEATDTTTFPLFITASGTQTLQPKNNTSLTFNSNTAQLGATTFNAGTGFQIGGAASSGKILKANGTNFVASTETYAAPGANKNVMKSDGTNWTSAAPTFEGMVEAISFQDAGTAIPATTYVLELYAEYAYTINEMRIVSGAGTVTANLKIGSTSVTSCSAVSVSTSITSCTASGANTVAVGDKITLVTTSNSGLDNLQATIKTTRN